MEMGMLTRRRGSCLSSAGVCAVGGVAHRTAPVPDPEAAALCLLRARPRPWSSPDPTPGSRV